VARPAEGKRAELKAAIGWPKLALSVQLPRLQTLEHMSHGKATPLRFGTARAKFRCPDRNNRFLVTSTSL